MVKLSDSTKYISYITRLINTLGKIHISLINVLDSPSCPLVRLMTKWFFEESAKNLYSRRPVSSLTLNFWHVVVHSISCISTRCHTPANLAYHNLPLTATPSVKQSPLSDDSHFPVALPNDWYPNEYSALKLHKATVYVPFI